MVLKNTNGETAVILVVVVVVVKQNCEYATRDSP
jgi:hypothetical protein